MTCLLLHELLLQRLEAGVAVAAAEGAEAQPQKLALGARCVRGAGADGSAVVASLGIRGGHRRLRTTEAGGVFTYILMSNGQLSRARSLFSRNDIGSSAFRHGMTSTSAKGEGIRCLL